MSDLEEIRTRALAATRGPWQRHGSDVWSADPSGPLFTGRDGSADVRRQADADAEFVARAREDVLQLLRRLDELGQVGQALDDGPGPAAPTDPGTQGADAR